jgi:glyoxylase-like metal-dependent hydrolase (beta-lactamase superfamily II)
VSDGRKRPELARADRVMDGVWRLRLPLPWPGVPHGNAFAIASDGGIVLFDTGIGGSGRMRQLELALAQTGHSPEDIRLVVCTHAHTDHYGLAAPILEVAGCELWMHPAWGHIRAMAEDPQAAMEARIEVARQSGVPPAALELYRERRKDAETGIEELVAPDRDLVPGVEVETDLGTWQVHETPGHAPSHVVLHQPESGLLISGDHLLGRVSVFFDYGHTPDPVAEFLGGLDVVEQLDTSLVLAGHGRPFRDVPAKVAANRAQVEEGLDRVRESLGAGDKTAFEILPDLIGAENLNPATGAWGLQLALAYLDHLAIAGAVEQVPDSDPQRWTATSSAA